MLSTDLRKYIRSGELDDVLEELYGKSEVSSARARYLDAIKSFEKLYGDDREVSVFSIPGRSELSGNHTDHNGGKVIAASVDLDAIAVASASIGSVIRIASEGYGEECVDFDSYSFPNDEFFGTSTSIIAGVVSGIKTLGKSIGAFDAYFTSCVPGGSGLSSSAVYENAVGTIINHFYNNGEIDQVTIAKISQYAENTFFGKPCGLMDQIACAVGGIVAIDFESAKNPIVERISAEPLAPLALCIVSTGGSHADLTDDYASVPAEMKAVAAHFKKNVLREITREQLKKEICELREKLGDRAVLRAIHFFDENDRVDEAVKALKSNDLDAFLSIILASGKSSYCYLQNVFSAKNPTEQGISLALCLAEGCLADKNAAWRVHGGGFAGTIQAFVPVEIADSFCNEMSSVFGKGACKILKIRSRGAEKII